MHHDPLVAIIVPVWNEEAYLPRLLESIHKQSILPNEVVVVDAASTDNTPAIVQSYPFTKYVVSPTLGVCEQRNYGASLSKSDIYIFCDADSILPCNCVETVKRHCKSTAGFPMYLPAEKDLFVTALYSLQSIYFWIIQWVRPIMAGPMMVIPRESFERVGGFNSEKQFEDVYISDLIGRHAPIRALPIIVRTSNRRFKSDGYINTTTMYLAVTFLAFFGIHIPKRYINMKFGHHARPNNLKNTNSR